MARQEHTFHDMGINFNLEDYDAESLQTPGGRNDTHVFTTLEASEHFFAGVMRWDMDSGEVALDELSVNINNLRILNYSWKGFDDYIDTDRYNDEFTQHTGQNKRIDHEIYGTNTKNTIITKAGDDYVDGRDGNDFIAPGLGINTCIGGGGIDVCELTDDSELVEQKEEGGKKWLIFRGRDRKPTQVDSSTEKIWYEGAIVEWDDLWVDQNPNPDPNPQPGVDPENYKKPETSKEIKGTKRNDELKGTRNSDYINGRKGDDVLTGAKGDDVMNGSKGEDILYGSKGDDYLDGSKQDDILYGQKGADVFQISKGRDLVKDFSINQGDRIALDKKGQYRILDDADGVLVRASSKKQLLLEDADFNDIKAAGIGLFVELV